RRRPGGRFLDQMTRLVKNGSVISATDGSLSSEVATVINSFLQFQQCQRFWNSSALTRSCHSRWTDSEPHPGHFSSLDIDADAMWNLPRFFSHVKRAIPGGLGNDLDQIIGATSQIIGTPLRSEFWQLGVRTWPVSAPRLFGALLRLPASRWPRARN